MRVFDDEFDMEGYIKKRLMEIENLGSRSLLKDIIEKIFLQMHGEIQEQYRGLEQRILDEVPMRKEGPSLVTNIVDRQLYDQTDSYLFPMRYEDLFERQIDTQELLNEIKSQKPFFLYTVFLKADYADTCTFDCSERIFSGVVKTAHGEYIAQFHVSRNQEYWGKIIELYRIFQMNYLPWRSVCAPYLFKLFDVYIDRIENFDAREPIEEATVYFEEFASNIYYQQIPLWNIRPLDVVSSTYPEPCLDKTNYEHRIFRHRFQENAQYLITNTDVNISNIRWMQGDLFITCPQENPVKWHMYQFQAPREASYQNRSLDNAKSVSFADNLMGMFQQPIKTKMELSRLLAAYSYQRDLSFVDMRFIPNYTPKQTYAVDAFIQDELRTGSWETALEIDFLPVNRDSYLNCDLMSFLIGIIQRHFPEYECCGKLV